MKENEKHTLDLVTQKSDFKLSLVQHIIWFLQSIRNRLYSFVTNVFFKIH